MSSPQLAYTIPMAAVSDPDLATVHPDVLVAIGAARFGCHQTKDRAWASSSNWRDESRSITAPEGRDADRKRFLDAIASLAVCDAQSQVIAVALKEDPQTALVVLCVAENGRANKTVVPHIENLLDILYKMAHEYAKLEVKSEITPLIYEYRIEFIENVYRHSVLKHLHRYEIRWGPLLNYVRTTVRDRTCSRDAAIRLFDLVCALEMVRRIHDRIAEGLDVAQYEWANITVVLDGAMADVNAIRDTCGPTSGAQELDALLRLTSPQQHITNLMSLVASGTLFTHVAINIPSCESLAVAPAERIQFTRPSQFERVIRAVTPRSSVSDIFDEIPRMTTALSKRVVHCECALISHLQRRSDDGFYSYAYIGASKLSCEPCALWIKAANTCSSESATKYHTNGTHKKWYDGWAMPETTPNAPIAVELRRLVFHKLRVSTSLTDVYWGPDSRPASPTGNDYWPPFQETSIRDGLLSDYKSQMIVELDHDSGS